MRWQDAVDPWADWDHGLVVNLTAKDARPPLRVAFYGRCSTKELQDPEGSKTWQLNNARGLLALTEPGATIVAEFFDVDVSRSVPWKMRPMASRLLAEAQSPDRGWDAIVIGETKRCFSADQFAQVEPILRGQGVTVHVPELGGEFNDRNSAHDIVMSVHGGLGKAERQATQDRTRAGMGGLTTQGRHMSGRAPYGYDAVGYTPHTNPRKAKEGYELKRLEPNAAAPVVLRIFEEVLAGKSLHRIATGLNRDGILCPSAADPTRNKHRAQDGWQFSTVRAIVGNVKYTGYQVWGRMKKVEQLAVADDPTWGYKTRFVKNDKQPVRSAEPAHEAIVSVEMWKEAQVVLRGRTAGGLKAMSKEARTRTDGDTQALRGVVHCAHCERKMWLDPTKHKSRAKPHDANGKPRRGRPPKSDAEQAVTIRYRCRRKGLVEGTPVWENHPTGVVVSQGPLMKQLSRGLRALFDDEHRDTTVAALTAGLDVPSLVDVRHEQSTARLDEAEKQLDSLIDSIEAGVDPALLAPRIKAKQQEVSDLRGSVSQHVIRPTITRADVESLVDVFADALNEVFSEDADPAEANAFFHAIGLRIDIDGIRRVARAAVHLAPESANPHSESFRSGDSVCVRGGT